MPSKAKELKNKYKQMKPEMGVFAVRNQQNHKCFLGSSSNLKGIFNRMKFQLTMGTHPNKELQKEWKEQGENNFVFEILDRLEYGKDETKTDYRDDLKTLKNIWEEKLNAESKTVFYKP